MKKVNNFDFNGLQQDGRINYNEFRTVMFHLQPVSEIIYPVEDVGTMGHDLFKEIATAKEGERLWINNLQHAITPKEFKEANNDAPFIAISGMYNGKLLIPATYWKKWNRLSVKEVKRAKNSNEALEAYKNSPEMHYFYVPPVLTAKFIGKKKLEELCIKEANEALLTKNLALAYQACENAPEETEAKCVSWGAWNEVALVEAKNAKSFEDAREVFRCSPSGSKAEIVASKFMASFYGYK